MTFVGPEHFIPSLAGHLPISAFTRTLSLFPRSASSMARTRFNPRFALLANRIANRRFDVEQARRFDVEQARRAAMACARVLLASGARPLVSASPFSGSGMSARWAAPAATTPSFESAWSSSILQGFLVLVGLMEPRATSICQPMRFLKFARV